MLGKLFLLDGSSIQIDNNVMMDGVEAGETEEELKDFFYCLMDKNTDPLVELILVDKIIIFPRKSISHVDSKFL